MEPAKTLAEASFDTTKFIVCMGVRNQFHPSCSTACAPCSDLLLAACVVSSPSEGRPPVPPPSSCVALGGGGGGGGAWCLLLLLLCCCCCCASSTIMCDHWATLILSMILASEILRRTRVSGNKFLRGRAVDPAIEMGQPTLSTPLTSLSIWP